MTTENNLIYFGLNSDGKEGGSDGKESSSSDSDNALATGFSGTANAYTF